jgi:GT2 family glycosyltransferase
MTSADRLRAENTSIVVVNFNGGEKLSRCIDALLATAANAEIVVIDNASTDGSLDAVRDRVRVIANAENAGYPAALNQGARATSGDVLVFLNMDVLPEQGWLEPLASFVRDHEDAGAVNPLIPLMNSDRINAAGQRIHVTGLGFNRGLNDTIESAGSEAFEVSGIQGAVFVMRRAVYEQIGGFDETGFLYHEDVNVSWLLRLAGYRLYCIPRSRVRHDYFLSMYAEKFHLLERNRVSMLLSYLKPGTLFLLSPMLALTEAFIWVYAILRRRGFVRAKANSYRWIARRWPWILERRRLARRLRKVGDASVLRAMHWKYVWGQMATLARERGESARKPATPLPLDR